LAGEGSVFRSVKFSPDDRHIFAVNTARSGHLWIAPTMEQIEAAEAIEKAQSNQP